MVPFTVSVNALEPALLLLGESDVIVGTGFAALIVNVTEFDWPPPGVGFATTTEGVPVLATSAAKIAAVTCVELTNAVVRATPLKSTDELETKLVPFTVNVNAAEPAAAFAGEIFVIVGTGLFAAVMLKFTGFDVPPPGVGFVTVTGGVPTAVRSPAKIAAVNCVALTNDVILGLPLKFTTEPEIKSVPFTVNVNPAAPTVAPVGDRVVTDGAGLVTSAAPTVKTSDAIWPINSWETPVEFPSSPSAAYAKTTCVPKASGVATVAVKFPPPLDVAATHGPCCVSSW